MKRNIINILVIALLISAIVLPKPLDDLDELWNYNFASNIVKGLLPYKDFNMVVTPGLAIILGIILKLTVNELIVMRIVQIILITTIFYVAYKILELLKVSNLIIGVSFVIVYLSFFNTFHLDYNFVILLITLIIVYLEIKINKQNKCMFHIDKRDFLLGILIGTSILFKQTTGSIVSFTFTFYKCIAITNKSELKQFLKIFVIRSIGVIIPVCFLCGYLIVNNIWYDFLDYTIYALNTFTNKISYVRLIKGGYGIIVSIVSILIPLMFVIIYVCMLFERKKIHEYKEVFIIFCYSIASFTAVYPISCNIHFFVASLPSIILLIYIVNILITNKYKKTREIKLLLKIVFGIITCINIIVLIKYFSCMGQYNQLKHFKYIPVSQKIVDNIKQVDNYILTQNEQYNKVYILDSSAAVYMIPINRYNKDYDMFLVGNLGSNSEEGQIEKLKNEENIILLILNDEYIRNWQNPEKVREYVTNNWNKKGQIGVFDIYEK